MVSKLYQHTDLNSSYTSNVGFSTFISKAAIFRLCLFLILSILLTNCSETQAQQTFQVDYIDMEIESEELKYSDSLELWRLESELILGWQGKGYLTANYQNRAPGRVEMKLGRQYRWAKLNIPPEFTRFAGHLENEHINPADLELFGAQCVTWFENRGYPFALMKFSNPIESDGLIELDVNISKGPLILYDSLIVKSDSKMSSNFFEVYLNIKNGEPYQEKQIASINRRLGSLPYVHISRNPETTFHEKGATTYLYLDSKNANRFAGIIGIQQSENQEKATIVGQLELSLINSLQRGESFSVDWQRFQSESQTLALNFSYPFVFRSQLGVAGELNILRQDSTYSSTQAKAGVLYQFSGINKIGGFAEKFTTSDLKSSAGFGSSSTTFYGLELDYVKVDHRINPRTGIEFRGEIAAGLREAPDSTDQKTASTLWKSSITAGGHLPIGKLFSIHLAGQGHYVSSQELFDNELARIGGFSTIRGFDESSIFASSFVIATGEVRFDFDDLSNVFLFVDQGWYEKTNSISTTKDSPLGLGIGASLGTNAGIFQISYAIGRQFDNPLLVKNAKLHFGFVSVF